MSIEKARSVKMFTSTRITNHPILKKPIPPQNHGSNTEPKVSFGLDQKLGREGNPG